MKKIFLILPLLVMCIPTHAQFILKVGALGGLPMGSMSDFYGATAGAEVSFMYQIDPLLSVGITSGFHHFFQKDEQGIDGLSANMIPIRGCVNYVLSTEEIKTYIGLEAGLHITMLSYDYFSSYYGYWYSQDFSATRFGIVPLVGIEMGSGPITFDMSARYTSIADVDDESVRQIISFLAVKVGAVIRF